MKDQNAPRWIINFFRWYCRPEYCEDLEGDLLERYADRLSYDGRRRAKSLLLWDVVLLFRPGLIRNLSGQKQLNQFGMFTNYIKVAFRIFNKEKGFTMINILGLALGISCSLFIYLWVNDELSYNSQIKQGDRVCFIMDREEMTGGDIHTYKSSPYLLKGVLENEYPAVEQAAILSWGNSMAFEKDQKLIEKSGIDASPEVFDMFGMTMLQGGSDRMKDHPNTIAISAFLLLPQFNILTGKQVHPDLFSLQSISILLGFVLLLGIISGLYPAFYLSLLSISSSVKGSFRNKKYDVVFRKGLVVFQFVITIIMITSAVTIYRQVSYIQSRNIGIDRSRLVSNQAHEMNAVKDYQVFKNELMKRPGIERMTTTDQDIMNIGSSTSDPRWQGKGEDEITEFYILATNPDFLPTTGIKLKEGRNFDWDLRTDTANFIINESAQRLMRLDKPVGQDLEFWNHKGKIIGVVGDFHNNDTHSPVKPLIIRYDLENNWTILTKTKAGQTQQALASLEEVYHLFNPKREFTYDFMDDLYNQQYKSDLMVKDLSLYFTILAIVISCLGLFALVAYTADRRTKEIGIRKVLGASLLNLLQLLSNEYARLLVISLVVAIPLAYYLMSGWLEDFAYHIDLSWWLFGLAGLVIISISYLIIGGQVFKSALVNPVDSLKSE